MKGFTNGINFGGWFSQCDHSISRYDNFIKEEDFKKVKGWGMDHIRLPFDYNLIIDEKNNYKEDGFKRLEQAVLLAKKYDLNIILDLHKTLGFSFDEKENELGFFENEKYQEIFYDLWVNIVKRFDIYSSFLAIELLNEVTDIKYKDAWNKIASTCILKIREISRDIKIFVGGYYNNASIAVKDIDVPFDNNIVLNFHCYEPLIFTHQGAYWIKNMDKSFRTKYHITFKEIKALTEKYVGIGELDYSFMKDDEVVSPNYFEIIFKTAIDYAEKKNVSLYCGEYGVIEHADTQEILYWYKDIHKVLNAHGIGHALWSYKEMDFDFVNSKFDEIRDEIIKQI